MLTALTFLRTGAGFLLNNWKLTLGLFALGVLLTLTLNYKDAIVNSVVQECNAASIQVDLNAALAELATEKELSALVRAELVSAQDDAAEQAAFRNDINRLLSVDNAPQENGELSERSIAFARLLNERARTLRDENE